MIDLHLRDAAADEGDAVREITLAAYGEYAAAMPEHWEIYRRSIIATLADVGPAAQIVAEQAGVIVGSVLLYPAGALLGGPGTGREPLVWPEVRLLAVAPAARGAGVGAALIRECIRRANKAGAAALTLHTMEMMRVAMAMYERMGFVHAPDLDLHPAPDLTVKGYRLELGG